MKYDLIVIGGGPAGYVGAIRAAQLGKRVACIEKERAGGTCLNWGCIPTKSLLRNAELYHLMKHRADDFGFRIEGLSYDWSKVIKRSRDVSDKNAAGIEFLFKKNKVDYVRGEALMEKPGEVEVKLADGKTETHSCTEDPGRDWSAFAAFAGIAVRRQGSDRQPGSDDPRATTEEHGHHRRGSDRGRVRLFLQCLWHQGDADRNAAERPAGRGYRSFAGAGTGPDKTGDQGSDRHEDD